MHKFLLHQLPNEVTLMACECGLTFRYSRGAEAWCQVPFRGEDGYGIEAPIGHDERELPEIHAPSNCSAIHPTVTHEQWWKEQEEVMIERSEV